jgi:hypothetical protein
VNLKVVEVLKQQIEQARRTLDSVEHLLDLLHDVSGRGPLKLGALLWKFEAEVDRLREREEWGFMTGEVPPHRRKGKQASG